MVEICAKSHPCSRILGILDSRVTMGAATKGRSSSRALSRILRSSFGYVLAGALYPGTLHCRLGWNRADGPTRDTEAEGPTRDFPLWLADPQAGDFGRFDVMMKSSHWRNPLGRWVRPCCCYAVTLKRILGPQSVIWLEVSWILCPVFTGDH